MLRRPLESAQYLSIRYSERLADAGVLASVGSKGDSYDNAVAESTIGLYKTELVRHDGPWKGLDDLELATLTYVDWVQPPPPALRLRRRPARRARGHALRSTRGSSPCLPPTNPASTKPGAGSVQPRLQVPVEAVLTPPRVDRLGAYPRSLTTSMMGRPASTRSSTLRRNSGRYPRLTTLRSGAQQHQDPTTWLHLTREDHSLHQTRSVQIGSVG